jgi:hypothetical protein
MESSKCISMPCYKYTACLVFQNSSSSSLPFIYSPSIHASTETLDTDMVNSSHNRHKLCYVVYEIHLHMITNNQIIHVNYLKICIMYTAENYSNKSNLVMNKMHKNTNISLKIH